MCVRPWFVPIPHCSDLWTFSAHSSSPRRWCFTASAKTRTTRQWLSKSCTQPWTRESWPSDPSSHRRRYDASSGQLPRAPWMSALMYRLAQSGGVLCPCVFDGTPCPGLVTSGWFVPLWLLISRQHPDILITYITCFTSHRVYHFCRRQLLCIQFRLFLQYRVVLVRDNDVFAWCTCLFFFVCFRAADFLPNTRRKGGSLRGGVSSGRSGARARAVPVYRGRLWGTACTVVREGGMENPDLGSEGNFGRVFVSPSGKPEESSKKADTNDLLRASRLLVDGQSIVGQGNAREWVRPTFLNKDIVGCSVILQIQVHTLQSHHAVSLVELFRARRRENRF